VWKGRERERWGKGGHGVLTMMETMNDNAVTGCSTGWAPVMRMG